MKKYIPLILVEGATVMAVELCGAKLLSPLYGGSLFVWAAILAVTLGALAFGYYYGGVLSSKEEPAKKLFNVLILAAICIALMPFLAKYALPYVSYINFKLAVILSASGLIFLPIFFLGCTTPLLVRINTITIESAGLISGKVYAISTVGGIVSTLLCGFFLIPTLGLKVTLISFSVILFITSVLILRIFKTNSSIPFLLVLLFSVKTIIANDDTSLLYTKYGIMGEIDVVEFKNEKEPVRQLLINKIVQTEMMLNTKKSTSDYIKCIDSIVPSRTQNSNALILGLGGGLLANLVQEKNYTVDAVEFDPRITESAKTFFYLSPSVNCFNEDARAYINRCQKKYDLLIFDLFKGEEQPVHTITAECFKKVSELLAKDGKMIINWHGYINPPLGKGTQILLNTLHHSNFATTLIHGEGGEDHRNTLIVCDVDHKIYSNDNELVNTDDLQVLELANAKANLRWRLNYLRFYQGAR
jgi:predicted membrane-bound spermidine synthase